MPVIDPPANPTNGQYYNGFIWNAANSSWDSAFSTAGVLTGRIAQVVTAVATTPVSNNTATPVDTGLTATITPKSATSKIIVLVNHYYFLQGASEAWGSFRVMRNSTSIIYPAMNYSNGVNQATEVRGLWSANGVDEPNTTSATTYKTQIIGHSGYVTTFTTQESGNISRITLIEVTQ